jgi:hypothetical protein
VETLDQSAVLRVCPMRRHGAIPATGRFGHVAREGGRISAGSMSCMRRSRGHGRGRGTGRRGKRGSARQKRGGSIAGHRRTALYARVLFAGEHSKAGIRKSDYWMPALPRTQNAGTTVREKKEDKKQKMPNDPGGKNTEAKEAHLTRARVGPPPPSKTPLGLWLGTPSQRRRIGYSMAVAKTLEFRVGGACRLLHGRASDA